MDHDYSPFLADLELAIGSRDKAVVLHSSGTPLTAPHSRARHGTRDRAVTAGQRSLLPQSRAGVRKNGSPKLRRVGLPRFSVAWRDEDQVAEPAKRLEPNPIRTSSRAWDDGFLS